MVVIGGGGGEGVFYVTPLYKANKREGFDTSLCTLQYDYEINSHSTLLLHNIILHNRRVHVGTHS